VKIVSGLPEDVVAMLFGKFSRNPKNLRDTLQSMIDTGHLDPPELAQNASEKAREFHKRVTIGYGHKSVSDHAVIHFAVEGASAVAERDFTEARLIAATSKSTRYVNFSEAGFVTPPEMYGVTAYQNHCEQLIRDYTLLVPKAVEAVRAILPFDKQDLFKNEKGWLNATEKRGLDMVRDVLPMSVKTSFGISTSITGFKEMMQKRKEDDHGEIVALAHDLSNVATEVFPVLATPLSTGCSPKFKLPGMKMFDAGRGFSTDTRVKLLKSPDWPLVEQVTGVNCLDLVRRWTHDRGHHQVPARDAELAEYWFEVIMPIAIHRDLGRHRMMTQLCSYIDPVGGYGCDPIFRSPIQEPRLIDVFREREIALKASDTRMEKLRDFGSDALEYACPMATMVKVLWKVNVRELVHLLGLRTTPQGHPAYRRVAQQVATTIKYHDTWMAVLIDEIVNFNDVLIGRPG
jgi:thymidylate synthase ThyX